MYYEKLLFSNCRKVNRMEVYKNICPICGRQNNCGYEKGLPHGECWCDNIKVPKELIALIPDEYKGKSCICQVCILEFNARQ